MAFEVIGENSDRPRSVFQFPESARKVVAGGRIVAEDRQRRLELIGSGVQPLEQRTDLSIRDPGKPFSIGQCQVEVADGTLHVGIADEAVGVAYHAAYLLHQLVERERRELVH
jgi:hypothetical protein